MSKDFKIKIIFVVFIAMMVYIAVIYSPKKENLVDDNSITSEEMREIVREEVRNELESFELDIEKSNENVDYDKIEQIVEDKLAEFNKDFGENFEDATTYFGGKIKDTWTDIEDHMRK